MKRLRHLAGDYLLWLQIVSFWPLVYLVMLPARGVDRALGTQSFERLVRLCKRIANR